MNINRDEIDLLIFISQTPDYRMPATSILLQDRLRLEKNTIAFDLNLGCSAFLYGLTVAYSMITAGTAKKVLILDGETRSKVYSQKDRKTGFLFGDGGIAVFILFEGHHGIRVHFGIVNGSENIYPRIESQWIGRLHKSGRVGSLSG